MGGFSMNKYYKAYEKRYKQMYELKGLWEVSDRTPEVVNTILKYNKFYFNLIFYQFLVKFLLLNLHFQYFLKFH